MVHLFINRVHLFNIDPAHYVYTFGYEEYVHTNKTNVYFMIADGWNSGVRYILYDKDKMLTLVTVKF